MNLYLDRYDDDDNIIYYIADIIIIIINLGFSNVRDESTNQSSKRRRRINEHSN